jgi:hypothetical protein
MLPCAAFGNYDLTDPRLGQLSYTPAGNAATWAQLQQLHLVQTE